MDRAILDEEVKKIEDVFCIEVAGVLGECRRYIERAKDGNRSDIHRVTGLGHLTIAAAFGPEIHNHGAGFHGRDLG